MKRLIILLIFLSSCGQSVREESAASDNVIHLSDAVDQMRTVKLSEIADSILYLPLSNDKMIGERDQVYCSTRHLFVGRMAFDYNGNYLFDLGRDGQGPGEDALMRIAARDTLFYGMGDKITIYNAQGKWTGKERSILGLLPLDFAGADANLALGTADTLYFINSSLDIIKEIRTVPDWPVKTTTFNVNSAQHYFTENRDSVLYYNYVNDTVYRLRENSLSPRWVIELKEQHKVPLKHILGNEMARLGEGGRHHSANDLGSWDYLKETDDKVRAFAVYEADNILIINWLKMREFWQLRNYPHSFLQTAYHNKRTGETVAVAGKDGFVDDISSLGNFYPGFGTHDNYMVNKYWPAELREKLETAKRSGGFVDSNLSRLLDGLDDEDNPVLVFVRLKK